MIQEAQRQLNTLGCWQLTRLLTGDVRRKKHRGPGILPGPALYTAGLKNAQRKTKNFIERPLHSPAKDKKYGKFREPDAGGEQSLFFDRACLPKQVI